MHKCMIAIGLTAKVQTSVQQSLCDVCACEHVPVVFFTFQLSVCQSTFPVFPTSCCSSVCVLFVRPYLSEAAWRHLAAEAKDRHPWYVPTLTPCITQLSNRTHARHAATPCQSFKKTRNKMLTGLRGTVPRLRVSCPDSRWKYFSIIQLGGSRSKKTEQRPFNV